MEEAQQVRILTEEGDEHDFLFIGEAGADRDYAVPVSAQ
jgi:hypothetical protein